MPVTYRPAILLAAWCQLRRSEILGLQRRDIDLENGRLRVERAWVELEGGGHALGPPKTEAGRRTVVIPPHVVPVIGDHLLTLDSEPSTWLFPGEDGSPKAQATINRPDLRFHDVRHSGLTWSASTGASVAEIMKRGGRSSPAAALRYQHATLERDRALADRLTAMALNNPNLVALPEDPADEMRTKLLQTEETQATITHLTRQDDEQSQRGSNPCLHLERVVS